MCVYVGVCACDPHGYNLVNRTHQIIEGIPQRKLYIYIYIYIYTTTMDSFI